MKKQGCVLFLLIICLSMLPACISNIWTGATLVYDRHNLYKKIDDYQLSANAHHALYRDKVFKQPGCSLDLAIFNHDILLAGHVPSFALRKKAESRLRELSGVRQLYNQVAVKDEADYSLQDSWITTKIRSRIFADSEIEPNAFKILTADQIVYVMGDVKPEQASRVLAIARETDGVIRVVKLLNYYNFSDEPGAAK